VGTLLDKESILMKRLLKILLSLFFLTFFISIIGLLGTEKGLHFIVEQAQQFIPGELKINQIQGRLLDRFSITGLSYRHQETAVTIDVFKFSWNSKALFNKEFHIQQLYIEGIDLKLPKSSEKNQEVSAPLQLPNVQLPLAIVIDQFQIKTVAIHQTEEKTIIINQLELQAIVTQQLSLQNLVFDSPQFGIKTAGRIALQPPYPLQLEMDWQANLPDNLHIAGKGQLQGHLQQLTLTQTLSKPTVIVLKTTIDQPLQDLTWTTQLDWHNLQWPLVAETPQVISQQGALQASGTLQDYQIALTAMIAAQPTLPQAKWFVKAQGNQQEITITELKSDVFGSQVSANGQIQWHPHLTVQLDLTAKNLGLQPFWADWPQDLTLNTQIIAQLADQQLKIEQWQIEIPKTSSRLNLQGTAILAGQETQFKTGLTWQQLQWPLTGKTTMMNTHQGQLQLAGTLKNYQLQLSGDMAGQNIPTGQWQIAGQGNDQSFEFKQLKGNLLKGVIHSSGKVQWRPTISWEIAVKGDKINPAAQWSDWPGQLLIDLESQGNLSTAGEIQTEINVKTVQGQLRNYPLKLQTSASIQGSHYKIKHFNFQSGKTHLTAQGDISDILSVQWTIDSPNLSTLLPQLQGKIKGKGQITGPLRLPHLIATAEAHSLIFQTYHLADLRVKLDVDLNQSDADNLIDIVATDLKQGNLSVKQVRLQGQGKITNHTLMLHLEIPDDQLLLQLGGNFDLKKQQWQGQLLQLKADSKDFGKWKMPTPTALTLSAVQVELAQLCLQNSPAKLCTIVHWQNGKTDLQVNLEKWSFELIKPFLPPNFHLEGMVEGQFTGTLHPDKTILADSTIRFLPGKVTTSLIEETLPYQGGTLKLQVNPQSGLTTKLELDLLKKSRIQGNLQLPRLSQIILSDTQSLQGEIQIVLNDLYLLPLLVPQVEKPQGTVDAFLTIGGTLTQPLLNGKLQIKQVAIDLPQQGLAIKDFNLAIVADGQKNVQIDASLRSGEGWLKLAGMVQLLSATDWKTQLQLDGERLEVINIPVAWALASPKINITVTPGQVDVTGNLLIPEAVITPLKAPSGAIVVSPDVTIVNSQTSPEEQQFPEKWAISSQVRVTLGEKVTVKGAGFGGRLGGSLVASNKPRQVTTGNGELRILEGFYKAYGQNLQIRQGKIIFAGNPIENPALDILAFRQVKQPLDDAITAGVAIQGNAQSPQLSLYSQPSMDQSNILSYLLLGKPVAQIAGNESQILLNALSSMPFGQGEGGTIEQIRQDLGLDTMEISSEGGVEAAALVVGKYLSPQLYISYGIGLFDNSNVVRLRYELTKRLTLETETGTQSGVDLRYTIER